MFEAGGLIWPLLLLLTLVALGFCLWLIYTTRRNIETLRTRSAAAEERADALTATLAIAPWPQISLGEGKAAAAPRAAALLGLPAEAPLGEADLLDALDATARARLSPTPPCSRR